MNKDQTAKYIIQPEVEEQKNKIALEATWILTIVAMG